MPLAAARHQDISTLSPKELRRVIAAGQYRGNMANLAPGYVQGNLVILPESMAFDFLAFCHANPKPCPLLAVSAAGDPNLPTLGEIDIRTDIPMYNVYRDGVLEEEVHDISSLWRDDLVTFILGCSYSFEDPLLDEGIPMRHIELDRIVPMYRTNIQTTPIGPFGGSMVVSMRPMKPADAIRAVQVTSRFPAVHGAPVHLAEPGQIGIADLNRPDWGDAPDIRAGEIPVFWACGVTPQVAIERARPPLCIAHKPGHMLVTDLLNRSLAVS
jgi:uncharacterized protein YcsI (UPF0317 family)